VTAALRSGWPSGPFLSASLALHLLLFVFLATATRFDQRLLDEERIIPVALVPLVPEDLPEPTAAAAPARVPPTERPEARPAPEVPPASPRVQPYRRAPRLDDIVVPDLISKIEPAKVPQSTLREKVPDLIKPVEIPAAAPRAAPRPAPSATTETAAPPRPETPAKPPGPTGPPIAGIPAKGVVAMGPIGSGAVIFPHSWYVAIVQNTVYQNWKIPSRLSSARPSSRATVAFRIRRNGTLTNVALKGSSGYTLMDRSAVEAVRSITALPPLPADYKEESLDVVVYFATQHGA
jgi:TonB family protein